MFNKYSMQYFDKYYLTVVFTALALVCSWALVGTTTQYIFFVLFNCITVFCGEYLINKTYDPHIKKYNTFKGILGVWQLLISCIVLWCFSM